MGVEKGLLRSMACSLPCGLAQRLIARPSGRSARLLGWALGGLGLFMHSGCGFFDSELSCPHFPPDEDHGESWPSPEESFEGDVVSFPDLKDESPDLPFRELRSKRNRIDDPGLSEIQAKEVVRGNVDLSFRLLNQLNQKDENLVVSGVSLATSMGMVYRMAEGETRAEIAGALNYLEDTPGALAGVNYIEQRLKALSQEGKSVEISRTNRLFIDESLEPSDAFLDDLAMNFGTGLSVLNFKEHKRKFRLVLNGWAQAHHQRSYAPPLIEAVIPKDTKWQLLHGLYLRGTWGQQMKYRYEGSFTTPAGEEVDAGMLGGKAVQGLYGENEQMRWGAFSYGADALLFLAMLPEKGAFGQVREGLSAETLEDILESSSEGLVDLSLPSFSILNEARDLRAPLEALGVQKLFTSEADLSRFSSTGDSLSPMTGLLHQPFFTVRPDGAGNLQARSALQKAPEGQDAFVLKLDRPFLFAAIDQETGLVLFAGQVTRPSGW